MLPRSRVRIARGDGDPARPDGRAALGTLERSTRSPAPGVPHESHGQEIKAVVVKQAGSGTTEEELAAWAKERLAAYKYPRVIQFVDELPLTPTGKILKRGLT